MSTHIYKIKGGFMPTINIRSIAGDKLLQYAGESDARIYTLGKTQFNAFIKDIKKEITKLKKIKEHDEYELDCLHDLKEIAEAEFKKFGYFEFVIM